MRTITLELLRHGPAHNQLLSPLTPYHALCSDHPATTVHVPFEHNQFLHRLRTLGETETSDEIIFQRQDTARLIAALLAGIPGLAVDFARGEGPIHLRLVISASELALLPFELAFGPSRSHAVDDLVSHHPHPPVCLTRETRRTPVRSRWPDGPRVLFAWAAPDGHVPYEAHLQALRSAIDPWVGKGGVDASPGESGDGRLRSGFRSGVGDHLTLIPGASLRAIRDACAAEAFGYIHVLAHGASYQVGPDVRFGLRLHAEGPFGGSDVVDGERLAAAIASTWAEGSDGAVLPVVTLAACDGANGGSIAGAGSSVAHALSRAGIPLVVASQFPLSFEASLRMVEIIYEHLLWGGDPRAAITELRAGLFAELPHTHDWASLTAYTSLPVDLHRQLADLRTRRAYQALEVALDHADNVAPASQTPSVAARGREAALAGVDRASNRLRSLLGDGAVDGLRRARIAGLLGSTAKRKAEILFASGLRGSAMTVLREAREDYWSSHVGDRAHAWALVQSISLELLLRAAGDTPVDRIGAADVRDLRTMAVTLSLMDREGETGQRRAWALSNLVELELLDRIPTGTGDPGAAVDRARELCRDLLRTAAARSFEVYATRRQILRYSGWYSDLVPKLLDDSAKAVAAAILEELPTV